MRSAHGHTHDRTALVLAGGGLTGAVYEIGALRAIDDLLVDRTVNDFDIFVGTSAGALVASMLANGLSPETMLKAIGESGAEVPPISREDVFHFDKRDLLRLGVKLPQTLISAWSHYLRHIGDMTLFDLVWLLSETLPSGLYDSRALGRYVRTVLLKHGHSDDFRELGRDLYIIATDLDNGQRAVFGSDSNPQVPISMAVAASTALPVLYKPVRIGHRDYLDGGLRGNASIDLAIEHGATLVICLNPLVPFDNSDLASIPFLGQDGGHLSEKGFTAIASQVGRITTHAGLHYHIKQVRRSHPEVDIILIEPSSDDYQMIFYNIMRYSARLIVARHGFESVTLKLAEDYHHYKELLARHNIPISRRLVIEELTEIQQSDHDPSVIRRVLEARSAAFSEGRRSSPVGKLQRTLAELERKLDRLSNERGASQEEDETINYPDSDGWDDAALSVWLNPEES